MYNANHQPAAWRVLLVIGDAVAIAISFLVTWLAVASLGSHPPGYPGTISLLNCLGIILLDLFFIRLFGLYRWKSFIHWHRMLGWLPLSLASGGLAFLLLRCLVDPTPVSSWLQDFELPLLFQVVACVLLVATARLLILPLERCLFKTQRTERIACVGWSKAIEKVIRGYESDLISAHSIEGFFLHESSPELRPPSGSGIRELGMLRHIKECLREHRITLLIVDCSSFSTGELESLTEICADGMVRINLIPWSFDVWADRVAIRMVGGVPIMLINDLKIVLLQNRFLKRAVDIVGAVVGMMLSAPLIGVLAVLIHRESPGAVFYRQVRSGYLGRTFSIIKLRSMRFGAEDGIGAVWAVENDPRRLRIGAFMRKWNLDELPQFWNVLCGQMSLVGPRPERPELIEKFRSSIRFYNLRHLAKPGITGWASVHGFRGNTSLEDRIHYDLYYIENWSLKLDFKIMLMTLRPSKNAY